MPHVKGIKKGDLIWCFICGHECKCSVSNIEEENGVEHWPKCNHCAYGFSCCKTTHDPEREIIK